MNDFWLMIIWGPYYPACWELFNNYKGFAVVIGLLLVFILVFGVVKIAILVDAAQLEHVGRMS